MYNLRIAGKIEYACIAPYSYIGSYVDIYVAKLQYTLHIGSAYYHE